MVEKKTTFGSVVCGDKENSLSTDKHTNMCWGTSGYLRMKYYLFLQAACGINICCNGLSVAVSAADYMH